MASTQTVRHKSGKHTFEVLVKAGTVHKWRNGEIGSLDNVLFADTVFTNASKGDRAAAADLKECFGTENEAECIKMILEKGDVPLTSAERKEKLEKRRAEIVNYIHKYFVDPKSKLPHPVVRIEQAMQECKFQDFEAQLEKQINDLTKKLPGVLTIKKMEVNGTITVPNAHIGAVHGILHKYCNIRSEQYGGGGCTMEITVVPGDYEHLISDLQRATKGDYDLRLEGEGAAATPEPEEKKGKGGKKGKKNKKGH